MPGRPWSRRTGVAEEPREQLSRIRFDRHDVGLARAGIAHVPARSARVERNDAGFDRAQPARSRHLLGEELVDADAAAPTLVAELRPSDLDVRASRQDVRHALWRDRCRQASPPRPREHSTGSSCFSRSTGTSSGCKNPACGPVGAGSCRLPGAQDRAHRRVPDEEALWRCRSSRAGAASDAWLREKADQSARPAAVRNNVRRLIGFTVSSLLAR